jgi:hypothetical protein
MRNARIKLIEPSLMLIIGHLRLPIQTDPLPIGG